MLEPPPIPAGIYWAMVRVYIQEELARVTGYSFDYEDIKDATWKAIFYLKDKPYA